MRDAERESERETRSTGENGRASTVGGGWKKFVLISSARIVRAQIGVLIWTNAAAAAGRRVPSSRRRGGGGGGVEAVAAAAAV